MKTLLIGNFGAKNLGDELILASALQDYPESIVMTADPARSSMFCEVGFEAVEFFPTGLGSFLRYLLSKNYRQSLKKLRNEVDQIVFPGGGLFAIKFRACLHWYLVFKWVQRFFPGKPIIFEHQGVDQGLGWISKHLARYVFLRANSISVRDQASQAAINMLCVKDVENLGDRVNILLSKTFPQRMFQKEEIVLINAVSKFDMTDIHDFFPDQAKKFILFDPYDRFFAPKSFDAEAKISPLTKTELLELFQKASYVVGERFHFLLLGEFFCGGKRTLLLKEPYAEKVDSLAKERGLQIL